MIIIYIIYRCEFQIMYVENQKKKRRGFSFNRYRTKRTCSCTRKRIWNLNIDIICVRKIRTDQKIAEVTAYAGYKQQIWLFQYLKCGLTYFEFI